MKRLSFLTALFIGAAKAQSITFFKQNCEMDNGGLKCTPREDGAYLRFDRNPLVGKPRNGECPVCGTMAEPFKAELAQEWLGSSMVPRWHNLSDPIYMSSLPEFERSRWKAPPHRNLRALPGEV